METPEQLYKTFNLVNHKEKIVELIENRDEEWREEVIAIMSACYAANSRGDAVIMAEDLILEV